MLMPHDSVVICQTEQYLAGFDMIKKEDSKPQDKLVTAIQNLTLHFFLGDNLFD